MPEKLTETAIEAAGTLAKEVYADALSPAVRRVGTALDSVFKIGLSPVALLDFGFEKSKEWLLNKIATRQATVPAEHQQLPPANIAVPALLAIATNPDSEELRNLYAEMLMKAMDRRTESVVHPSYVTILTQLTPQEALVFMSFRGRLNHSLFIDLPRSRSPQADTIEGEFYEYCKGLGLIDPDSDVWLQNLLRLRLIELTTYTDAIYRHADYDNPDASVETRDERHLTVTEYGKGFMEACTPPAASAA